MPYQRTTSTRWSLKHERTLEERIFEKLGIRDSDECHPWLGYRDRDGYGKIGRFVVNRVLWEIRTGEKLTRRDVIMHTCDNPPCCNFHHLRKGTNRLNIADRHSKGRSARGERNGSAKLSEATVREIRERYATGGITLAALGRDYGVTYTQIRFIVQRLLWAHVT